MYNDSLRFQIFESYFLSGSASRRNASKSGNVQRIVVHLAWVGNPGPGRLLELDSGDLRTVEGLHIAYITVHNKDTLHFKQSIIWTLCIDSLLFSALCANSL